MAYNGFYMTAQCLQYNCAMSARLFWEKAHSWRTHIKLKYNLLRAGFLNRLRNIFRGIALAKDNLQLNSLSLV
jgi:hypothetical protein